MPRGSFSLSNDFHVHWAPLAGDGDLPVSTRPSMTGWPQTKNVSCSRKYARGAVAPWDTSSLTPHSDGRSCWAYEAAPPAPAADADYHRRRAAVTRWPAFSDPPTPSLVLTQGQVLNGKGPAKAFPAGSGYFRS
ncbi:MAG: hypothetical protein IPP68_01175 [Elusimicrobia bacterium]|nr:hypothetical protein [Elusimicrobiota bacterium]